MTGLLTFFAVATAVTLLISAAGTGARATASDSNKRGPWGILRRDSQRSRVLNPHQRRWQTTLLSGKDNPARWTTTVNEIAVLEKLRGIDPVSPAPASHDTRWLEASIAGLEASVKNSTPPGDTQK